MSLKKSGYSQNGNLKEIRLMGIMVIKNPAIFTHTEIGSKDEKNKSWHNFDPAEERTTSLFLIFNKSDFCFEYLGLLVCNSFPNNPVLGWLW